MFREIRTGSILVMGVVAAGTALLFCGRARTVLELTGTGAAEEDLQLEVGFAARGIDREDHGPGCRVSGLAVEEAGHAPIPGAVVVVTPVVSTGARALPGGYSEPRFAVTDLDGRWTIGLSDSDAAIVSAAAVGFLPEEIQAADPCGRRSQDAIVFRLRRGGVLVRGTLAGLFGNSVGDALVLAEKVEPGQVGRVVRGRVGALSGAEGRYWLQLGPGDYDFQAIHSGGLVSRRVRKSLGDRRNRVDFTLLATASVAGRVRTHDGEGGLGGIALSVVRESSVGAAGGLADPPVAWTNDLGEFEIEQLRPGRATLNARGHGLTSVNSGSIELVPGERATGVELWLEHGHSISGEVLGDGTKAGGVPNIWVYARDAHSGEVVSADRATDEGGHFEITGLRPSTYLLDVLGDRSMMRVASEPIIVVDSDIRNQRVLFDPGVTVSGQISASSGATIRLRRALGERFAGTPTMATSVDRDDGIQDGHGSFTFNGVAPGKIVLAAETEDGRYGEARVDVDGHDVSGITINLKAGASISGRVVDATGEPARDAWVAVSAGGSKIDGAGELPTSGTGRFLTRSDEGRREPSCQSEPANVGRVVAAKADGSFELKGLEAGEYHIAVHGYEGRLLQGLARGAGLSRWNRVTLARGEARTGVVLEVDPCLGDISGSVLDSKGDPVSNAWVVAEVQGSISMQSASSGSRVEHDAISDRRGLFSLLNLCLFTYRIRAYDLRSKQTGYASNVPTGASLKLRLEPMRILEGAVEFRGKPVEDYSLVVSGPVEERVTVRAGSKNFRASELPAGTYEVFVEAKQGYGFASVNLTGHTREWLSLNLMPWSSLHGKVSSRGNLPVAGIDVALSYLSLSGQTPGEMGLTSSLWSTHARTESDGSFKIEHIVGRRSRISFASSSGPLMIPDARMSTSMGVFVGPSQWLEIPPWSSEDHDLGTIEVMTGEFP